jgi:GNAT superfamily N-acetyltransferase
MNRWGKAPEEIGAWYIIEVKKWCAKQDGTILIAERGKTLLGYANLLSKCDEDGTGGDFAYAYALVTDLVVTKSARGQGIGKALLEACENIARAKGRQVLRIGVLSKNESALQIYQNFGFTPHHLRLEKILK